ncbi:MAG TPA: hypothetical protein PLQ36_01320, partial [Candidatus Gracilibacteria bacterium]|nr:hypothetical protein [Candidatus Gracilibacteria bacterium]
MKAPLLYRLKYLYLAHQKKIKVTAYSTLWFLLVLGVTIALSNPFGQQLATVIYTESDLLSPTNQCSQTDVFTVDIDASNGNYGLNIEPSGAGKLCVGDCNAAANWHESLT